MKTKLGTTLRHLRSRKGFTVNDLAKLSGVGRDLLYDIENGTIVEPRLTNLIKLADALDVTLDQLVGRSALPPKASNETIEKVLFEVMERLEQLRPRRG